MSNYNPQPEENYTKQPKQQKKTGLIIFLVVLLVTSNFVTFYLTKYFSVFTGKSVVIKAENREDAENINKLLFLKDELTSNYLWDLENEDLWTGVYKGLFLATGDPYVEYMTAEEFKQYEDSVAESFYGIGAQIINDEEQNVEIMSLFSGLPAYKAGLKIGDVFLEVDGESMLGKGSLYVSQKLRGEEGTEVTVKVLRGKEELTFTMKREMVEQTIVEHRMLDNKIGYIHVYEISENSHQKFKKALDDLTNKGMKSLILDMRQNPGGNVDQALLIADEMLPAGEIIYTIDHNGMKEVEESTQGAIDIPIVALIDENSASASEIIVGSLSDNKVATVVGHQSFGKGIIQILKPLKDGSVYKYTFQEYFLPSSKKIHGVGIEPDYVVEKGKKYENTLVEDIPFEEDKQLQKAIELLK